MTKTVQQTLEHKAELYLKRKEEIRRDDSLSWEQKELAIRRLGLEYDKACKEVDRRAA
jgi:hypothetical protein